MARNIIGTQINGVSYTTRPMAFCTTAAGMATKTANYSGFSLAEGATLIIMFVNGNTAPNPTLDVGNTGPRGLYYRGGYLPASLLKPNIFYELIFDGEYWIVMGEIPDHEKNTVLTQHGTDTSGTEITIPVISVNSTTGHVKTIGTRKHTVAVQKISKFCTIAGGQNKDKYFYIGSVLCDQAWSGYHANLSFVGAEAAWSGILYFGFRLGSELTSFSGVELKWLSLTRPDVSDKIVMTYTDETEGRRVHLYFKYPADYLTTSISIISEGETGSKPFVFNGAVSSSPIGTVYKTSSIDSNSSSSHFQYGVELPQGTWAGGFDLSSGNNFIFECDDTVEMGPRQSGDGLYVKLAAEYKQKILNLENYISTLVAENEHQIQQINDLKSTLESIITGKTWDSNIWGGSSGTTTQSGDEPSETTPPA